MNKSREIKNLRRSYTLKELTRKSVSKNPIEQFSIWFNEAMDAEILDVNAMTLATADNKGYPSARTVLLKQFDETGFVFYTNYNSKKGKELSENPNAALLFFWKEIERQVRISGAVMKTTEEESKHYFNERPIESRLSAWASNQSTVIPGREYLENKFEEYKKEFEGKEIQLPPYWGGFRVIPSVIEFWQGRDNRLHDRICYIKNNNTWDIVRLSP